MNAGLRGSGQVAGGGFVPFGGPGDTRQWVRVAIALLDRIARGVYGSRLPGRAVLVAEFGVAARTVQRAISKLAGRDVVYRVPGLGYHIRQAGEDAGNGASPVPGGHAWDAPDDPRAWMRITAALLDRIGRGELKPFDLLPARKTLCDEFRCSRCPVTHALTDLERHGVIRRIPGVGYKILPVSGDPPPDTGPGSRGHYATRHLMPGRTP